MPALLTVLKNPSIFRQNSAILHPKRAGRDTEKLFMWWFVGVLWGFSP
jgi:hypothetical protein